MRKKDIKIISGGDWMINFFTERRINKKSRNYLNQIYPTVYSMSDNLLQEYVEIGLDLGEYKVTEPPTLESLALASVGEELEDWRMLYIFSPIRPSDIPRTLDNYKNITELSAVAIVFNLRLKKGMELKNFSYDLKIGGNKNV